MMDLTGRNALVTGGSRGIGAAIALALAKQGANVLINYTSDSSKSKAEEVVRQIAALKNGAKAFTCQADVGKLDIGKTLFAAAKESFGDDLTLHILVHNAGVSVNEKLEDLTMEAYDSQMNINVRGPILITKEFLPYIKQGGGGRVILLSSVSARNGSDTQTVYGATKAAVEHFARCWRNEWGRSRQIQINTVNPGPVTSDMWQGTTEEFKEDLKKAGAPIGDPEHIADIVVFLASDASRWVNGSTTATDSTPSEIVFSAIPIAVMSADFNLATSDCGYASLATKSDKTSSSNDPASSITLDSLDISDESEASDSQDEASPTVVGAATDPPTSSPLERAFLARLSNVFNFRLTSIGPLKRALIHSSAAAFEEPTNTQMAVMGLHKAGEAAAQRLYRQNCLSGPNPNAQVKKLDKANLAQTFDRLDIADLVRYGGGTKTMSTLMQAEVVRALLWAVWENCKELGAFLPAERAFEGVLEHLDLLVPVVPT